MKSRDTVGLRGVAVIEQKIPQSENIADRPRERILEPWLFPGQRRTFDLRVVFLTSLAADDRTGSGGGCGSFAQADRPRNQLVLLRSTVNELCLAGDQPTRPAGPGCTCYRRRGGGLNGALWLRGNTRARNS